jgi:hypothetical protein
MLALHQPASIRPGRGSLAGISGGLYPLAIGGSAFRESGSMPATAKTWAFMLARHVGGVSEANALPMGWYIRWYCIAVKGLANTPVLP